MNRVYLSLLLFSLSIGAAELLDYELDDDMSVSDVLLLSAHNTSQSRDMGWLYYQQIGTLREQWRAGARGGKLNLFWRKPVKPVKQLMQQGVEALKEKLNDPSDDACRKRLIKATIALFKTGIRFSGGDSGVAPFIALGHAPRGDAQNNCFLSVLQKGGKELDAAVNFCEEYAQLLKDNPNELIIIVLESYLRIASASNGSSGFTDQDVAQQLNAMIEKSGLHEYAYKLDSKHREIHGKPAEKWPTVGELRKQNKRAIIFIKDKYLAENSPYLTRLDKHVALRTQWRTDWETLKQQAENDICEIRSSNPSQVKGFFVGWNPQSSLQEGTFPGVIGTLIKWLEKLGVTFDLPDGSDITVSDYDVVNSYDNIMRRVSGCSDHIRAQRGDKVTDYASPTPVNLIGIDMVCVGRAADAVREINQMRQAK